MRAELPKQLSALAPLLEFHYDMQKTNMHVKNEREGVQNENELVKEHTRLQFRLWLK